MEFILTSFLNRFSYKNAKAGKTRSLKSRVSNEDSINTTTFIEAPAYSIPPDKAFFHKYFGSRVRMMEQGLLKLNLKKKSDDSGSDDEEGVDRFADKLAEELMTSAFGNPDMDDDDDYENEDFSASADNLRDTNFELAAGLDDENGSPNWEAAAEDAFDDSMEAAADEDDEIYEEPLAYGDEEETKSSNIRSYDRAKNKDARGKRKRVDDFADADEYEKIMDEIVQFHSSSGNNTESAALAKEMSKRQRASNARFKS